MKLSKNKIKQLLKVKNQSQKRLHNKNNNNNDKNKNNKKYIKHFKRVKTARLKTHTDLRHKTLRRRLKGGGNVQASSKEGAVLEGINIDKARMLEEKKDLDDLLSQHSKEYVVILDEILNYFDKFTQADIDELKKISKQTSGHDKETDVQFMRNLVRDDTKKKIYHLNTLFTSIISDLNKIHTLLSEFIQNKPLAEISAQSDKLNYITNIFTFMQTEYLSLIKAMSQLPTLLLTAKTAEDNVKISQYLLQLCRNPQLRGKHEEFKALIEEEDEEEEFARLNASLEENLPQPNINAPALKLQSPINKLKLKPIQDIIALTNDINTTHGLGLEQPREEDLLKLTLPILNERLGQLQRQAKTLERVIEEAPAGQEVVQEVAPIAQEVLGEEVPAVQEVVLPAREEEAAPLAREEAVLPAREEAVLPAREEAVLPAREEAAARAGEEAAPAVQEVVPVVQEVVPAVQEVVPVVQEVVPAVQEVAPAVQEVVPVVQEVVPAVQEVAPAVQEVAPAVQEAAPAVQEAVLPAVQEAVLPAVQEAVLPAVQEAVLPVVQEAAPAVQEAVLPAVQEAAPLAVEEAAPLAVEEAVLPARAGEAAARAGEEAAPLAVEEQNPALAEAEREMAIAQAAERARAAVPAANPALAEGERLGQEAEVRERAAAAVRDPFEDMERIAVVQAAERAERARIAALPEDERAAARIAMVARKAAAPLSAEERERAIVESGRIARAVQEAELRLAERRDAESEATAANAARLGFVPVAPVQAPAAEEAAEAAEAPAAEEDEEQQFADLQAWVNEPPAPVSAAAELLNGTQQLEEIARTPGFFSRSIEYIKELATKVKNKLVAKKTATTEALTEADAKSTSNIIQMTQEDLQNLLKSATTENSAEANAYKEEILALNDVLYDLSGRFLALQRSPEPVISLPTYSPIAIKPSTSGPSTSGPSTSGPSTSGPSTSGPASITNEPITNEPIPNEPIPNEPIPNAPIPNAPTPNAPTPNAPIPNAPGPTRTSTVNIEGNPTNGIQEFIVRIKYPVAGSTEYVVGNTILGGIPRPLEDELANVADEASKKEKEPIINDLWWKDWEYVFPTMKGIDIIEIKHKTLENEEININPVKVSIENGQPSILLEDNTDAKKKVTEWNEDHDNQVDLPPAYYKGGNKKKHTKKGKHSQHKNKKHTRKHSRLFTKNDMIF